MDEKWKEYYTEEEIKKIQAVEIESLRVFLKICEQLQITCFLYGGTLLGAVKYEGFVPWDDDLDLALMRDDYEHFLKEAPALLSDEYEIQHPKLNKYTPYPYIKFRRKDTKLVEYVNRKLPINHGIYFDVYPIDNIPDSDEVYKQQLIHLQKIVNMFLIRQCKYFDRPIVSFKDVLRCAKKRLLSIIYKCIPHSYFVRKIDSIMTQNNNIFTKRQGNLFFPRPVNYFDGVLPSVKMKFEGMELQAPKGYKVNLYNRYGDISSLPPKEKRVGHKPYVLEFEEKK